MPRLEVGVRHDGGDAETGFGLDIGGGLSWSHPASGLSAELSGRGLLTHESRGFRDRGLSASFGWDPGRGTGRGPKLTLSQTVGASASGGMDALLGREDPRGAGGPTTMGTTWRTAGWSSGWATALPLSGTASPRRRSSVSVSRRAGGNTASAGASTLPRPGRPRWSCGSRRRGARAPAARPTTTRPSTASACD